MFKYNLGDKVKDKITGFTGIVIVRLEYVNGCIQYGVKRQTGKNKPEEPEYFDEKTLTKLKGGINIKKEKTGGIMPDRPKKSLI